MKLTVNAQDIAQHLIEEHGITGAHNEADIRLNEIERLLSLKSEKCHLIRSIWHGVKQELNRTECRN